MKRLTRLTRMKRLLSKASQEWRWPLDTKVVVREPVQSLVNLLEEAHGKIGDACEELGLIDIDIEKIVADVKEDEGDDVSHELYIYLQENVQEKIEQAIEELEAVDLIREAIDALQEKKS